VQQVSFVDEQHGVDVVAAELSDMRADGVEYGSGGCGRCQSEREANVSVEVAATERGVVAVRQPKAVFGQAMA
jgi:hypothetical protein